MGGQRHLRFNENRFIRQTLHVHIRDALNG